MENQKLSGYPSIDKPWLKYYTEEVPADEVGDAMEQLELAYMEARNYANINHSC